jgi:hypothetical protein
VNDCGDVIVRVDDEGLFEGEAGSGDVDSRRRRPAASERRALGLVGEGDTQDRAGKDHRRSVVGEIVVRGEVNSVVNRPVVPAA